YWPFIEILRAAIGLSEREDETANWRKLVDTCTDLFGDDAAEIIPYIATVLSWQVPPPYAERVRHLEPEALGAQVLRAVWRLVLTMVVRGPVVLAIEDLHWIDGSSQALLEHLLPLTASIPLLFFVLSRPEEDQVKRFRERAAAAPGVALDEIRLTP